MKISILLTSLSVATASNIPNLASFFSWKAPGPNDVRGPCPMLNTLANHGFLPHDGKNIDEAKAVGALHSALNISEDVGAFLHSRAVLTNPQPNATTWSLETLRAHNIVEHDGSFSRADHYFFNDSHSFNQAAYEETRSYWTGPMVDIEMAALARVARIETSNATNPVFELTERGTAFGLGEAAAYVVIIGDKESGTVPRPWLEFFFENEKLPLELGWRPAQSPFTFDDLESAMIRIRAATPNADLQALKVVDERNIHGWA